jgi:hypothetical protein
VPSQPPGFFKRLFSDTDTPTLILRLRLSLL